MKIETRKLKDLIPAVYNPRKASKQQEKALSDSLKKYGCVEPIIVNEYQPQDENGNIIESENRYNVIIGGHFRVRELIKLKVEEVECVIVNLNLEAERELNIRLNSNTGDWNIDLLVQNFNMDELETWGFNTEELDKLEFKTEEDKVENLIDDSDELPEIPEQSKTRVGDLFYLGEHRLLCGDSTDPELVKLLMHKNTTETNTAETNTTEANKKEKTFNTQHSTLNNYNQASLVITDPPYNVAYNKSKDFKKILNDEMSKEDFYNFLYKVFKNYNDIVLKDGGGIYIFHSDSERINFTKAFIEVGFYFSQILIWVKNHFVMGRQDYQNKHEPILYGWKKGAGHYFIDDRTNGNVFEDEIDFKKLKKEELIKILESFFKTDEVNGKPTSVIHCEKPNKSDLHPTMKPIKILGKLIINSSKKNDLIVDLFGGSGSTLIASHQLERVCYTMELDPHYCDIIIERWQNLTSEEVFRNDGVRYNDL